MLIVTESYKSHDYALIKALWYPWHVVNLSSCIMTLEFPSCGSLTAFRSQGSKRFSIIQNMVVCSNAHPCLWPWTTISFSFLIWFLLTCNMCATSVAELVYMRITGMTQKSGTNSFFYNWNSINKGVELLLINLNHLSMPGSPQIYAYIHTQHWSLLIPCEWIWVCCLGSIMNVSIFGFVLGVKMGSMTMLAWFSDSVVTLPLTALQSCW